MNSSWPHPCTVHRTTLHLVLDKMKDETDRSWHEPSTFRIPFEFQRKIGQLDSNTMHILIKAYTQTMENTLLDSDWISIALDGEVEARYAWIKPLLAFSRLPSSLEAPYENLVPSFSLDRGPMWGRNPKSKSVKWITLWGQFVVQKWFNTPIIPYASPGPKG